MSWRDIALGIALGLLVVTVFVLGSELYHSHQRIRDLREVQQVDRMLYHSTDKDNAYPCIPAR